VPWMSATPASLDAATADALGEGALTSGGGIGGKSSGGGANGSALDGPWQSQKATAPGERIKIYLFFSRKRGLPTSRKQPQQAGLFFLSFKDEQSSHDAHTPFSETERSGQKPKHALRKRSMVRFCQDLARAIGGARTRPGGRRGPRDHRRREGPFQVAEAVDGQHGGDAGLEPPPSRPPLEVCHRATQVATLDPGTRPTPPGVRVVHVKNQGPAFERFTFYFDKACQFERATIFDVVEGPRVFEARQGAVKAVQGERRGALGRTG
jgi:hypothetical protein